MEQLRIRFFLCYNPVCGKAVLADIRKQWDDDQIMVADDNPGDLLSMAQTFPQARFFLIKDWTTNRLL